MCRIELGTGFWTGNAKNCAARSEGNKKAQFLAILSLRNDPHVQMVSF
jgi:hypothetical protein